MKVLAVVLSLALTTKAFSCPPVTPLSKGEETPCDGFLFSQEKELQLRIQNEDYKLLIEQSKLYLQQKELYQKQLLDSDKIADKEREKAEKWRLAAETATEKLVASQEKDSVRDWVLILSGVGLTVLAGWSLGQASK